MLACSHIFLSTDFSTLTDSLTQVVVPGQAQLSLNAPRTYTIFLEEQSVVDGRIYSTTESVDGLKCTVTSQSENQQIPMRRPGMSITYNAHGRSGRSVLAFPVKVAGQYTLFCNYPQDTRGPQTVVAVGTGVGEKLTQTVLWSLVSMFGGMGSGAFVIALVIMKRRAAEKKLVTSPSPLP